MTIHAEILGTGPNQALLHGWGMHREVWRSAAERLAERHRVMLFDLPGHGQSAMPAGEYTLPHLADTVAAALPAGRSTVIGWSLGGMVALELALRHPERVNRLVLVGSTPQFTADRDWPHAVGAEVLEDFAARLKQDPANTLQRFLALQVHGSEAGRRTLARLQARLAAAPAPDPRALEGGLDILRHASLLARLPDVAPPVLLVHGNRDTLIPVAAATAMAERLPRAELRIINGAAHAPFLSHPDAFFAVFDREPPEGTR